LRSAFADIKGFSSRNLKYMRKFAETYPDEQIVQQAAAQIPWFHFNFPPPWRPAIYRREVHEGSI
jgi:hypothetical protein